MHPLKRYLRNVDEPLQDFARRIGASRQTLYRILQGSQTPKPGLAMRIVEATGGVVTLDALYTYGKAREFNGAEQGAAEQAAALLDPKRIKLAIAVVVSHLTGHDRQSLPSAAIDAAVDAVMKTYSALSCVTRREGPDRLRQALRPVLEEVLHDISTNPSSAAALDYAANLAAKIYYQSQPVEQTAKPAGHSKANEER